MSIRDATLYRKSSHSLLSYRHDCTLVKPALLLLFCIQVLSPRADRDVFRSWSGRCCEVDKLDDKMAESFLAQETAAVVLPWSAIQPRNDRIVNDIFTCHLCTYFGR